MDPEAVRRTLEPTASAADISGSTPYDSFVISGVRLEAAEHGRVLCSFVVTPRIAEEIEVEAKLLRAGKSVGVISVDFRKKRSGKLMAQARHTKYLAVSSRL
ncbi:hypothetical protein ACQJBY_016244 [Aegilops geniculata]